MIKEIVTANKNYASIVVSPSEHLDKTAIKVIRQDCPPFLMPMRLVSVNNEIQIRYELSGGIRMAYMPMQMNKRELNQFLYQMLIPFDNCTDWFLDYHNIYFDSNYIMVDQDNFKIKYIYLPYEKLVQTEEQIMRFFGDFVMNVELQDEPAYIATLLRCIMGKDASVSALLGLLTETMTETTKDFQTKSQMQIIEKKSGNINASISKELLENKVVQKQPIQEKEIVSVEREFGKKDLASSIEMGLFGEDGSKNKKEKKDKKPKDFFGKLFGGDKKNKKDQLKVDAVVEKKENNKQEIKEYQEYAVEKLQPDYDIEAKTEFMEAEESDKDALCLKLESSVVDNIPKSIELNMSKGYAVVGRYDKSGKLSADFNFDMSLTFIGRRHVRFEKTENDVYVIDLESKNHTYLNGEELLPNRRYLLKQGDRVTITKKYGITYRIC